MVVLALLTLFAVLGITFVYYADAEAKAAQVNLQAEIQTRPDMDPELVFSQFLNQMIFDLDNQNGVYSAIRGHSFARSMYGANDTAGAVNILPFNGTGRLHATTSPLLPAPDDYSLINRIYFPSLGDAFVLDPERMSSRANPSAAYAAANAYFGVNAPYTYPDFNNLYLAAVKADGTVLTPSFHRSWGPFGAMDPTNGNWYVPSAPLLPSPNGPPASPNPVLKYQVMRPRPVDQLLANETWDPVLNMPCQVPIATPPVYRTSFFGPPEDGGGDVKNLVGAPGIPNPSVPGQYYANDSFWMDVGAPVMISPDGRKYKALFAPLIIPVDNRVDLSVHGNIRGWQSYINSPNVPAPPAGTLAHVSNQGFGPWSVNPSYVFNNATNPNEWTQIFVGRQGPTIMGKYGYDQLPGQGGSVALPGTPTHFYNQVDFDEANEGANYAPTRVLTPSGAAGTYSCFPTYPAGYGNGSTTERTNHPLLYNSFQLAGDDRQFPLSNLEALCRYGDTGSSSFFGSELLRMAPNNFNDPLDINGRRRRLVTLRSFDIDRPGIAPWNWQMATPANYTLSGLYPSGAAVSFPTPTGSNTNVYTTQPSEFGSDWRAITAALGRLDLNRTLPDYPTPSATTGLITDLAGFQAAQSARQQFASDIYNRLLVVTGASNTVDPNATRWLAQLAVNIVDFIDTDDYITPFNYNGTNWVFGTELPRVVINEAYAEWTAHATKPTNVSVWVELLNTFNTDPTLVAPPGGNGGDAPLATPTQPVYQIMIAQRDPGPNAAPTYYRRADNVWGTPYPIVAGTDNTMMYPITLTNPATGGTPGQQLGATTEAGVSSWTLGTNIPASNGGAGPQGYYLVGPGPIAGGGPTPGTTSASMSYQVPTTVANQSPPAPTILLQRLACPYMTFNNTPGPTYNPFITVDYMQNVDADPTSGNIVGTIASTGAPCNEVTTTSAPPSRLAWRQSDGRDQPYYGYSPVTPTTPLKHLQTSATANQPQTTFPNTTAGTGGLNSQVTTPGTFNWLVHLDRQLVSPMELLHVSAFKPHELTQEFVDPGLTTSVTPFQHRVPWFDEDQPLGTSSHRLYRFFELVGTRGRAVGLQAPSITSQTAIPAPPVPGTAKSITITPNTMCGLTAGGTPLTIQPGTLLVLKDNTGTVRENVVVQSATATTFTANFFTGGPQYPAGGFTFTFTTLGDRVPGKININNVWGTGPGTSVGDSEILNALCDPQTSNNFTSTDVSTIFGELTSTRSPSGSPSGTDVPYWGGSTGLYPGTDTQFPGYNINYGLYRAASAGGAGGTQRMFEPQTPPASPSSVPYIRYQLLNKIFNNVTTRSNVFAVWVTVGFFEVIDDTSRPVKLGAEIGRAENRNIRHRLFAIIDRTNLNVFSPITTLYGTPGTLAVTAPGLQTVQVKRLSARITTADSLLATSQPFWTIQAGSTIVVGTATNQELVTVQAVNSAVNPPTITAYFNRVHEATEPVNINVVPGNPGPQARFNPHDPIYAPVVPYFSIIN
jgi:hypothetical protein